MSDSTLPRAPGAKAAKICGILAIVFALTCVGFPIAIILGITALVQQAKAKRLAKAQPGSYEPVTSTGLVTGIIGLVLPFFMLPVVGIASAIAIPALLGQRARARDKAAMYTMTGAMSDLVGEYDRLAEQRMAREAIPSGLEAKLRSRGGETRNPWDPAIPAFSYSIEVVEVRGSEALAEAAEARATEKGVAVFVISLPDPSHGNPGGYLAGAVRLQAPLNGKPVMSKVVALD
jgi:hypothetical protein